MNQYEYTVTYVILGLNFEEIILTGRVTAPSSASAYSEAMSCFHPFYILDVKES